MENEAFWASGKVIEEDNAAACSCAYDWTHGPAEKDEDARPNVELDGKVLTAKVGRLRRYTFQKNKKSTKSSRYMN